MKIFISSCEPVPFCLEAIEQLFAFLTSRPGAVSCLNSKSALAILNERVEVVESYGHIIERVQVPSIVIVPVRDYPRVHDINFLRKIPPELVELVNKGDISLVFDHSNEANSRRAIETFAARMREIGIRRIDGVHWICGNHLLPESLFGVRHHKFNYFEVKAYVDIMSTHSSEVLMDNLNKIESEAIFFPKNILSLNATPRPERVAALLSLFKHNLIDKDAFCPGIPNLPYISFGGFDEQKAGAITPSEAHVWLIENDMKELIPYLDWIADKTLSVDHYIEKGNELFNKVDLNVYLNTSLSYVTETTMSPDLSRFTEKSLKPLLFGHPVIVAGTIGSVQLLRRLGFSLLDNIIDHSYDFEPCIANRIDASVRSAKHFMQRVALRDSDFNKEVIPHLKHNLAWGSTGYPACLFRRAIDLLKSIESMHL